MKIRIVFLKIYLLNKTISLRNNDYNIAIKTISSNELKDNTKFEEYKFDEIAELEKKVKELEEGAE